MMNWVGGIFAIAFFIGGNLWFYFRFFGAPPAEVIEEDHEHISGDFQ
jgi:hypothetical protein